MKTKHWLLLSLIPALIAILTLAIGLSVNGYVTMIPGGIFVIGGVIFTIIFCCCAFPPLPDSDTTLVVYNSRGERVGTIDVV